MKDSFNDVRWVDVLAGRKKPDFGSTTDTEAAIIRKIILNQKHEVADADLDEVQARLSAALEQTLAAERDSSAASPLFADAAGRDESSTAEQIASRRGRFVWPYALAASLVVGIGVVLFKPQLQYRQPAETDSRTERYMPLPTEAARTRGAPIQRVELQTQVVEFYADQVVDTLGTYGVIVDQVAEQSGKIRLTFALPRQPGQELQAYLTELGFDQNGASQLELLISPAAQ